MGAAVQTLLAAKRSRRLSPSGSSSLKDVSLDYSSRYHSAPFATAYKTLFPKNALNQTLAQHVIEGGGDQHQWIRRGKAGREVNDITVPLQRRVA
jgi:hypothetical protein